MGRSWNRKATWVLFFLLVAAVPGVTQTLDLGDFVVSLGMAKQQALKMASEAGYKILDGSSPGNSVKIADPAFKHVYMLQFTSGRLTYADRSWTSANGDDLEAAIKALTALAQKGATSCNISHAPISEPDTATDRVFIMCGQRGVLMIRGRLSGIENFHEVTEFVGMFR